MRLELSASTTAQLTSDIVPRKNYRFIVSTVLKKRKRVKSGTPDRLEHRYVQEILINLVNDSYLQASVKKMTTFER